MFQSLYQLDHVASFRRHKGEAFREEDLGLRFLARALSWQKNLCVMITLCSILRADAFQ